MKNYLRHIIANNLILKLLLGVAMAGCSDEASLDLNVACVSIDAVIDSEDCQRSRAEGDDPAVTRCLVEIVQGESTQGIFAMDGNGASGFSFSKELTKGQNYTFYFWADCGKECYDASDFTQIAVASGASPSVAFAGSATLVPSATDHAVSLSLTHAVAKVSYVSTTALATGKTVTMTIPSVYPSYNARTSAATGSPAQKEYSLDLSEAVTAQQTVMSAYAFVDGNNQAVELKYGFSPTVTVSNAPVAHNTHTCLTGDISGQVTLAVSAAISSSWTEANVEYSVPDDDEDLDYVDLGLSVYWAKCNLGADNPEDEEYCYQWGCFTNDHIGKIDNYNGPTLSTADLPSEYDTATHILGEPWRMPTKAEWEELMTLTRTVTAAGFTYTSANGNKSIFIPVNYYYSNEGNLPGSYYWSSTTKQREEGEADDIFKMKYAACLSNNNIGYKIYYNSLPIRPVRDK